MRKLTRLAWIVLLTAVATAGCDRTTPTRPTSFSSSSNPVISVAPSPLLAERVEQFACPAVPPFDVPFHLLISTNDTGFVVTNITARFVDTGGVPMPQITLPAPTPEPMPQVTLPAPVPTTQVGTALAESRDLPLSLGIGCDTGHTGTLTVVVTTLDGKGHRGSSRLAADVR